MPTIININPTIIAIIPFNFEEPGALIIRDTLGLINAKKPRSATTAPPAISMIFDISIIFFIFISV